MNEEEASQNKQTENRSACTHLISCEVFLKCPEFPSFCLFGHFSLLYLMVMECHSDKKIQSNSAAQGLSGFICPSSRVGKRNQCPADLWIYQRWRSTVWRLSCLIRQVELFHKQSRHHLLRTSTDEYPKTGFIPLFLLPVYLDNLRCAQSLPIPPVLQTVVTEGLMRENDS